MEQKINQFVDRISHSSNLSTSTLSASPIILIILAGLLSLANLHQQEKLTSKEIQGTLDIEYLIDLRNILKESRGLRQFSHKENRQMIISGVHLDDLLKKNNVSTEKNPTEIPTHLHEAPIKELLTSLRKEMEKKLSAIRWLEIKNRYGFHMGDIKVNLVSNNNGGTLSDFERYSDRLEDLNEYFSLVADKSNLILDPEIDTYYLMSLTSDAVPKIVDIMAEVRGLSIAQSRVNDNSTEEKIQKKIDSLSTLLIYQLDNLNRIINILSFSSPATYKKLGVNRIELVEKVDEFRRKVIQANSSDSTQMFDLWNEATITISSLSTIQFNGLQLLRESLQERKRKLISRMILISVLFIAAALLVYIFNKYMFDNLSRTLTLNEELANTDALTKLLTRRSLNTLYEQNLALSHKTQQGLGVCILDIDFFKLFNDHYGHLEGDDALVQVSNALKNILLRESDHLFRYGGEEFVILTLVDSETKLEKLMAGIRKAIENLKIANNASLISQYLTISLGGVFIPANYIDIDLSVALKIADNTLYTVKEKSRNAVSIVSISPTLESIAIKSLKTNERS